MGHHINGLRHHPYESAYVFRLKRLFSIMLRDCTCRIKKKLASNGKATKFQLKCLVGVDLIDISGAAAANKHYWLIFDNTNHLSSFWTNCQNFIKCTGCLI